MWNSERGPLTLYVLRLILLDWTKWPTVSSMACLTLARWTLWPITNNLALTMTSPSSLFSVHIWRTRFSKLCWLIGLYAARSDRPALDNLSFSCLGVIPNCMARSLPVNPTPTKTREEKKLTICCICNYDIWFTKIDATEQVDNLLINAVALTRKSSTSCLCSFIFGSRQRIHSGEPKLNTNKNQITHGWRDGWLFKEQCLTSKASLSLVSWLVG